jgi:hypothetical protein
MPETLWEIPVPATESHECYSKGEPASRQIYRLARRPVSHSAPAYTLSGVPRSE